jgi:hypothetical protein
MSFAVARRGTLIDGLGVGELVLEVFSSLHSSHVGIGLHSSLDPTRHGEESVIHGRTGVVFRCPLETVRGRGVASLPSGLPRLATHGHMVTSGGHDLGLLSGVPRRGGSIVVSTYQLGSRCSAFGSVARGLGFPSTYLSWNLLGSRRYP